MNLIDAVNSGRPWRRKDSGADWWESGQLCKFFDGTQVDPVTLLLADYEIQEPEVRITKQMLTDAVVSLIAQHGEAAPRYGIALGTDPLAFLAKRLGLE
jgi:hypothetical protein